MWAVCFYLATTVSNLHERNKETKSSFLIGCILFLFLTVLPRVCFCIKRSQGRVNNTKEAEFTVVSVSDNFYLQIFYKVKLDPQGVHKQSLTNVARHQPAVLNFGKKIDYSLSKNI